MSMDDMGSLLCSHLIRRIFLPANNRNLPRGSSSSALDVICGVAFIISDRPFFSTWDDGPRFGLPFRLSLMHIPPFIITMTA